MKKKYILLIILIIVMIIGGIIIFMNREYPDDENTLYSIKLDNVRIRFERYDYALGQNQVVGVEKSTNKGKTFIKITEQPIIVSMEPKFIFLTSQVGFAITKPNLTKSNNYSGVKVTNDGGKTFVDGIINYDNSNIEIITVEDTPYIENNYLKLPCSIYQVKEDKTGYEDVSLIFVSKDNGLTWNLED